MRKLHRLKIEGKTALNGLDYIPIVSAVKYLNSQLQLNPEDRSIIGFLGHSLYALVGGFALTLWGLGIYETGQINPSAQRQIYQQREVQTQEIRNANLKKYLELHEKLFGEKGLADTNNDGKIDESERREASRRMGTGMNMTNNLEEAVRSYEEKK